MKLFDAIVMVDWSSASRPSRGRDSIWLGTGCWSSDEFMLDEAVNLATRREAEAAVVELLERYVADGLRVLVGFDFPYGYPSGFARAIGCADGIAPWRDVWTGLRDRIQDDARNLNNRFEIASDVNREISEGPGPFWGCPTSKATQYLERGHKDRWDFPYPTSGGVLERLRITEGRLSGVQETWKLLGQGSVGSQALVGIPCVARIRDHPSLSNRSGVWPFETGFSPNPVPNSGPFVLHGEIWPGAVRLSEGLHPVRDAAQVLTLAKELASLDSSRELSHWFETPFGLNDAEIQSCLGEEGWILGAGVAR